MPSKYVPNGRPNGGKRAGAGRTPGSKNAHPLGALIAVKRLAPHRIPPGTPTDLAEAAGDALEAVRAVLRGEVRSEDAHAVLKAAQIIRLEICGAQVEKHDHTGNVIVEIVKLSAEGH